MAFNIIPPQVPFTTADGRIAREWYIFLLNLFESNGSGNNALTQDQFETLFLAGLRTPNTAGIESAVRELAATLQTQRSERAAVQALTQRVSDLEELLQNLRPAPLDPRIPDLQTITFGSRPWL